MKRPFVILGSVIILALASSSTAHAVLIDRGYGLIYDTELNITWLQDANYARTQGLGGTDPAFPLGQFTWAEAMAWADNLVYAGYSDWRLPTTLVPDLSCAFFESTGYNCTGSEMGHLYYIDGIRTGNSGPFFNVGLSDYYYWSSTEFGAGGPIPSPSGAATKRYGPKFGQPSLLGLFATVRSLNLRLFGYSALVSQGSS